MGQMKTSNCPLPEMDNLMPSRWPHQLDRIWPTVRVLEGCGPKDLEGWKAADPSLRRLYGGLDRAVPCDPSQVWLSLDWTLYATQSNVGLLRLASGHRDDGRQGGPWCTPRTMNSDLGESHQGSLNTHKATFQVVMRSPHLRS